MRQLNPLNFPVSLFILFILFSVSLQGQTDEKQTLTDLREKIPSAFNDEKACTALYKKYKDFKNPETILKGYIGGLHIARSRHAPLLDKMSALKTGTAMLEEALKEKPDNIELRFLRLSIQLNLPGFLGYDDNIAPDKKFVLKHYASALSTLRTRIINFIRTSGFFNDDEKAQVFE